jgi:hypothetical protein
MSSWAGRFAGNALDPLHIVYKPDAPDDANRDAAIAASAQAENTATGDAEQRYAQIYGHALPTIAQTTGNFADASRLRQGQVVDAATAAADFHPGTFDAREGQPQDIRVMQGQANLQDAAMAARAAQLGQQRADLGGVLAGQAGMGPSVAASQQAAALDAARRNAGIHAAAVHGGNAALAARGAMGGNMAQGLAVQGAQARGQELAGLRAAAGAGQQRLFGNQLGMDQSLQQQEQLRNTQELANRAMIAKQAGLASDAFGQAVRDYRVGGALTKTADSAKLSAFDDGMSDQEGAFGSYQDYLHNLYGTSLDTAVKAGQRASGNLDTILGAQRSRDAGNAALASTLIGGVMGAVGGGAKAATSNSTDYTGGGG